MRILNRPMFRYGGPIKEGIMHGVRSNYAGGRRAALVGDPNYPRTDGREHHVAPVVYGIGAGLARVLPWAARGAKAAWKYMKPTSIPKYKGTGELYKTPFTFSKMGGMERAGKWARANPGWTATGALSAYNAPGTYEAGKGAAGLAWKGVKQAADLAVPDWIWDQDKWEKERAEKMKPPTDIIKPGGFKKIIKEEKKIDKTIEQIAAEAKAGRTKKLNKYLDTMGYDKAKKTAMGDALIDASSIVQAGTEEGGSLKHANWSKMINQAIQATSKRLDKPDQIREAVGLMLTKSEIEKDLEDPQIKKLRALQIEQGEKELEEGFEKSMSEFIFGSKTAPDKSTLERYARLKADEHGLDFTKISDEVIDKVPEGATEEERMQIVGMTDDGIYMIGGDLVRIKDGVPKQIA